MKLPLSSLPALLPPALGPVARWSIVCGVLMSIIAFTGRKQYARAIPDIIVEVHQAEGLHFVDEKQVYASVQAQVLEDIKRNGGAQNLHLGRLERSLEQNPYISKATVSQDVEGRIQAEIHQTRPIARIMGLSEGDFYITEENRVIPVSNLYTARVILLEGPGARALRAGLASQDSAALDLLALVRRIRADEFWRSQAAALQVSASGEVTIHPQVGQQVLELGPPIELDSKFKRLDAFYNRVLPTKGWGRYHHVSVKYQNQIVCQ